MIDIQNVTKYYESDSGKLSVLDSISLFIKEGEFISLIGPSGCGKTTLLKIVAGLESPSYGRITIQSRSPQEAIQNLIFAFNFQFPVMLPWKNVKENILLPIKLNARKFPNGNNYWLEKCDELIAKVGLTGFESFLPNQLSGGMQARVALARSLIYGPPVFLLDEPFSSVDEITRYKLNYELSKISQESKKTVVLVTHNIEEAILLSDRIVLLSGKPCSINEILEVATPKMARFHNSDLREMELLKIKIKNILYSF